MIYTGLVSITFRQLTAEQVIKIVKESDQQAIEWGGDIHVPHGDIMRAREVCKLTKKAGLITAAYGSYYRVGISQNFEKVLETAVALGAPTIRVWAGDKASDEADKVWWNKVIVESRQIAQMAQEKGIKVAYEYHANTLTDTNETAIELLAEVNHPNMFTYWQPHNDKTMQYRLAGLSQVLPYLCNMHVFYWKNKKRYPLSEGKERWKKYLEVVSSTKEKHFAMLEFVKDDSVAQYVEDAKVLKELLDS